MFVLKFGRVPGLWGRGVFDFDFEISYLVMNTEIYWHFFSHCNVEIFSETKKDGTFYFILKNTIIKKMTRGAREVRSDKSLTLLTFNI